MIRRCTRDIARRKGVPRLGLIETVREYLTRPQSNVLIRYRLAMELRKRGLLGRFLSSRILQSLTLGPGVEISPFAEVGDGLRLPHPHDIVVGAGARIGPDVTLYNGVTLGSSGSPDRAAAYPAVGEGSVLFTGAKVLGGITLGRGCTVAANAVVLRSVPDRGVVGGVPARALKSAPAP